MLLSLVSIVYVVFVAQRKKRLDRGFEPLKEIFMAQGIEFYSPFYKNRDWKQNHQHKQERKKIAQILKKKSLYPLPNKTICLVDDVCTSGASLEAALSQMDCAMVFVVSAHPVWIQEYAAMRVSLRKVPWK